MADKYEPTADVHNIFIFVLVPIIMSTVLSTGYKKFMERIEFPMMFILFAIYYVLPTVIYSYRSNFFEVFGKTPFIMTYFALPFLVFYLHMFVLLVGRLIFSSKGYKRSFVALGIKMYLVEIFVTSDFIVNIYYFSYFCQTTFKTYYYLYIVVPISCLYLISLLMHITIFKKTTNRWLDLLIVCFILKIFAVTTIISSSTIVTNSLLTLFIIPVLHTYYLIEERASSERPTESKDNDKIIHKEPEELKKFVEELTAQGDNLVSQVCKPSQDSQFNDLYQRIQKINELQSEDDQKDDEESNIERIQRTQKVIRYYYSFGKALKDRFDHYKQYNERMAQALVNEEVRSQLSGKTAFLHKKERAKRIYDFFNVIGEDKINKVKSFSAVEISELSSDDIDYVLAEIAKKYLLEVVIKDNDDFTASIDVNPAKKDVILPELMINDNEEITG